MNAIILLLLLAAAPAAGAPYFVANEGQWQGDFQFKCEVGSTIYYVTPQGMTIDFRSYVGADGNPPAPSRFDPFERKRDPATVRGHVVQIHYSGLPPFSLGEMGGLRGASGQNKLPHYSNYFLGRDSTKWRSRVSHYQNIIVPEVWPGINVEYRADQQGVETIYHVKPGADPTQIQMEYLGLDAPLRIDSQGNLVLTTSLGDVKEKAPYAYQQERGMQKRVNASFRVIDERQVGYDMGAFDAAKELVVDPLIYSTFFANGTVDAVTDIEVDSEGFVVVSGNTNSGNFPVTPGAYWEEAPAEFFNGFLTKLNQDLDDFVFSTYFVVNDLTDIVVALDNSIWWLSGASSETFPITANAFDTLAENTEIGVAHISADGDSLLFGSFWGGNDQDQFAAFEQDYNGIIYISGTTRSNNMVTTEDAFSRVLPAGQNAFLVMINPVNHSVVFSTYMPTESQNPNTYGSSITLIEPGKFWWIGGTQSGGLPVSPDAFQPEFVDTSGWNRVASYICLMNVNQLEIEYCSYWGNSQGEWGDRIWRVLPLNNNELLICGTTLVPDYTFPPGGYQQFAVPGDQNYNTFIARFSLQNHILGGTFLGAHGWTYFYQFELLRDSSIVMAGLTSAIDYPTTPDAEDSTFGGGEFTPHDVVLARLSSNLSTLMYSTYWGGREVDRLHETFLDQDEFWLVGETESFDFLTTPDAIYPAFDAVQSGYISSFEFIPNSIVNVKAPSPNEYTFSAFPNPFNPTTTLEFTLPSTSSVELTVHDILGREVTHENLGRLSAGQHVIHINGFEWSSGIYFATLKTPTRSQTTKLLLLR